MSKLLVGNRINFSVRLEHAVNDPHQCSLQQRKVATVDADVDDGVRGDVYCCE